MNTQRNNSTGLLVTLLMAFYILWRMPIVALYSNTYLAMGLLILLTVLILLLTSDLAASFPKLFVAAFFYFLVMVADYAVSGGSILNNVWSIFLELFPIFIGYLLVRQKWNKPIDVVVWLNILAYALTALTTYIGLQVYPEACRILATDGANYSLYYRYNIGGFDFIYTLVLIHPMVICLLRQRRKWLLSVAFSAIGAMCVFASAYTFAALLYLTSCVAYLLPLKGDFTVGKRWVRFLMVLMMLSLFFLPNILRFVAKWDVLEASADKLLDAANMLQGIATEHEDTESRMMFYQRSVQTFLEYPVFGGKLFGKNSGGHSFIMDMLANWGILGMSVIVYLYVQLGKYYYAIAGNSNSRYFAVLTLLMAIVLAVLNPDLFAVVLGLVVPLSLYSFERYKDKCEHV